MIDYVKGLLAELTPTYAVVEAAGVGYELNISLPTYSSLEGKENVKLLVHEVIREDAHVLFGFLEERERAMFRLLIGVSGVGANTARVILSSIPVAELELVIMSGDHSRLKNVKGIGIKTAQRVIVDLKDKIKPGGDTLMIQPSVNSEAYEEALAALLMLGFAKPQSQKVLKKLFDSEPSLRVEAAIKGALAML
ncbi:MAG TPA: Holliday junction branch migration protein RuvA [Muribaculum sp.]|jgi:Holliday junction DNA helicase RuvA|uniref:Holliday junction branch migration complex subunit RuvA n=1 Tax=Heminiphilus faecis TaxID=2601703 RepID=A0ABV4CRN6_9BACT|nr:Holliday junction branch migration protein RuvA [Heminiphilus faecis]RLT78018.1 Holliday junction branch migration protein RuvA [bacterium J10(2018)]HRF68115.1 Holliday junction branch migration protein RuvA [Muribaculum sp.]